MTEREDNYMGIKVYNEKDAFIRRIDEKNGDAYFEIKNKQLEEELYELCYELQEINLDIRKTFDGNNVISHITEQQLSGLKKLVNDFVVKNEIVNKDNLRIVLEEMLPHSRDRKINEHYRQHVVELEEGQLKPSIYFNLDNLPREYWNCIFEN